MRRFDSFYATLVVQADDMDGEDSSFESAGVSDCSVTISEYGAVGEAIRGTFSAELEAVGGMTGSVEGSFDLVRGSDS